jgi:hypothetical protein
MKLFLEQLDLFQELQPIICVVSVAFCDRPNEDIQSEGSQISTGMQKPNMPGGVPNPLSHFLEMEGNRPVQPPPFSASKTRRFLWFYSTKASNF